MMDGRKLGAIPSERCMHMTKESIDRGSKAMKGTDNESLKNAKLRGSTNAFLHLELSI